ncbi:MAG: 3-dehydroquinate synthase [Candidatus Aminicenantes bacterium]
MNDVIFSGSGLGRFILHQDASKIPLLWDRDNTVLVTDARVRTLHPYLFEDRTTLVLAPGEKNKSMESVHWLYRKFMQCHVDRSRHIVGIGGGVICDLTGFAAATFLRGVPFSFVPTTLLAQVDASAGGKNGFNFGGYKNMVGTFAVPREVIINFDLLKTLPRKEILNGMAEIVKHALISDSRFFSWLERTGANLFHLKKADLKRAVTASLIIKSDIVQKDLTDQGKRHVLNFGHTFGHALESRYGISHGESVSVGMSLACFISHSLGKLQEVQHKRILTLMRRLDLPVHHAFNPEDILDAVSRDKKKQRDRIRFVGLSGIGRAEIMPLLIPQIRTFSEKYLQAPLQSGVKRYG